MLTKALSILGELAESISTGTKYFKVCLSRGVEKTKHAAYCCGHRIWFRWISCSDERHQLTIAPRFSNGFGIEDAQPSFQMMPPIKLYHKLRAA
jgi:hypothetical protein